MENAVDALKVAGSVLIFVLALSLTISTFTMASQALNRIFTASDEEEYVTDADGNYLNFVQFNKATREVGIDTIIPMIYRAYKENFAIYFYDKDGNALNVNKDNEGEDINYFDLEKEIYASSKDVVDRLDKLLYTDGLYNNLKNKTFYEQLGEYYMDDAVGDGESDVAEVNKIKKRVIAYTEK